MAGSFYSTFICFTCGKVKQYETFYFAQMSLWDWLDGHVHDKQVY